MDNRPPRLTVRGDPRSWLMGGATAVQRSRPDETTEPAVGGPITLPPPTGPPVRLGFGDEYSCGVTEFLRRVGIGRTKLYQLLDGEKIESFLLDGKRMILIASWLEYVARQQAAERAGQLRKGRAGRRGIGQPEPSNAS